MKTTPLTAAIARLDEWTRWQQHDHSVPISRAKLDNPYARDPAQSAISDTALVLRALKLLEDAEHTNSHDTQPIFEIDTACLWTNGPKGLLHCLGVALVNEDLPEGGTFK